MHLLLFIINSNFMEFQVQNWKLVVLSKFIDISISINSDLLRLLSFLQQFKFALSLKRTKEIIEIMDRVDKFKKIESSKIH